MYDTSEKGRLSCLNFAVKIQRETDRQIECFASAEYVAVKTNPTK
jgi:hypothetical protein